MNTGSNSRGRREFLRFAGGAVLAVLLPQRSTAERPSALKTSLVYHNIYLKHETGRFHFESPERFKAILQGMDDTGFLSSIQTLAPREASLDWIEKVHSREYIDIVRRDVLNGARYLSTKSGNTTICKHSFEVALWAAGGVMAACDAVMSGRTKNAFCAVRPPGHHATVNRGMGYCLFNNAAIAARYLQKKHKLDRILIVDWDVHHGNGTQDIFYEDGSVFFFSTHQWPWYPWTGGVNERGKGEGRGTTLNVPLPAGAGDVELIEAFEKKLMPQANLFKPDFVLISAGFDSRNNDPLGRFRVTDGGFKRLTQIIIRIAKDHAKDRLVSVLEGGYSLKGLAQAVPAHVEELMRA